DVHEDYVRSPTALQHRLAAAASPALGPLLDQWFAWLDDPASLSSKTRRPYAPKTTQRYKVSWARVLALLPRGREATLADVTKGFLADFRAQRRREGAGGATVNRDLCAVGAFLTWCEQERAIGVYRPALPRERACGTHRGAAGAPVSRTSDALPRRTRGPRVYAPVRLLSAGATRLPARPPRSRPARRPHPRPQAHVRRTLRAGRDSDRPHPATAWAFDSRDGIALHEARAGELLCRGRSASGGESVR